MPRTPINHDLLGLKRDAEDAFALAKEALEASGGGAPGPHTHDAADVTSGLLEAGRMGSGEATGLKYLRGDRVWATLMSLVPDHGELPGLLDDDHPQYLLRSEALSISPQLSVALLANPTNPGPANYQAGGAWLSELHYNQQLVDLTHYTQTRLVVSVGDTTSALYDISLRYLTSQTNNPNAMLAIGTSAVEVVCTDANTTYDSAWIDLAEGAKADVYIAVVLYSDPPDTGDMTITHVYAQFR